MAAAQHKLSRRALLAGACAGAVPLPLARHCEEPFDAACGGAQGKLPLRGSDAAIQCGVSTVTATGLLPPACAGVRNDERWQRALALYARAEAGVEAVAGLDDDSRYDRALRRHNAALARLLRTAAPDLAAVAGKLDLILRHSVIELTFGEACLAALRRDIRRFAAVGPLHQPAAGSPPRPGEAL